MSYTRDSSEDLVYNSETGQYEPVPVTATLTINPTPADATVTFNTAGVVVGNSITVNVNTIVSYNVSRTGYISKNNLTYTVTTTETIDAPALDKENYTLTVNTDPLDATVTFSTGTVVGNQCTVPFATSVTYTVSRTGYTTSNPQTIIVSSNQTVSVVLDKENYTITVITDPADATVTFSTGTISGHNCTVPYDTTVTYTISKTGYITSPTYTKLVTANQTISAPPLELDSFKFTINPTPTDATVVLTATGYTQEGNSITVPYGTEVSYSVSKIGYDTVTGSRTITSTSTLPIELSDSYYTLTVNTDPLDATVTFSTGTVSQDGHSCTVKYNTLLEYSVSKTNYVTQNFSKIITMDEVVNVTLSKQQYTLTIISDPIDAIKTLYIPGSEPIIITDSYDIDINTVLTYTVSKFGYITYVSDMITMDGNKTENVELVEGFQVKDLDTRRLFKSKSDIETIDLHNKAWVNNSMASAFSDCTNLTTVTNIHNAVTNMTQTFMHCRNLTTVSTIPNTVTTIRAAFTGCTNLVNAPTIPDSVTGTGMINTFEGCSNLVNVSAIPNGIEDLHRTFTYCTNLVNIPNIPNTVTNMIATFQNCWNITTIPTIPNSVVRLVSTFDHCTNLTGDIIIESENITTATNCFINTSLTKNVYIPFRYENSVNTATYNAFTAAGYDTLGTQHGVYLKNLGASYYTLTISPTPSDATVVLTADGYMQEGNSITVEEGTSVTYIVSKLGYNTETDTITINSTQTLPVSLTEILYTLTLTPTPNDATVKLEASSYQTVSGTGEQSISVRPNTIVTYTVSKSGYDTETDDVVVTQDPQSLAVSLNAQMATLKLTVNETGGTGQITAKTYYTSSLGSFVDGPELMLNKEMQAPVGDTIYWIVRTDDNKFTAAGYNTLSAGQNTTSTSAKENKILTLSYTPTDATITVTDCTGYVVSPKSTSAGQNIYYMPWWGGGGGQGLNTTVTITGSASGYRTKTITATRSSYNSDTTATLNLIGEDVTLTINPSTPSDATITFNTTGTISGNSITVPNGTEVSYNVARTGYITKSNLTYTATQTETISAPALDKENYTLTINTTPNDATVTFNTTGTVSGKSITVPYDTTVSYNVARTGYVTKSNLTYAVTTTESINAPALDKENYTLTINTTPSNATVTFNTAGTVSGKSITVPYDTVISYNVTCTGYTSKNNLNYTVTTTETINAPALDPNTVTLTINPTPNDATVTLTAAGYTQSGNSIAVPIGTSVNWSVTKTGYQAKGNTVTVNADTPLSVELQHQLYAWSLPYNSSNVATVYTRSATPDINDQLYDANDQAITSLYSNEVGTRSSANTFVWKDTNLGEHQWQCMAYGNNKYVAISMQGYVSTSTDGTHWATATALPTGLANTFYALTFGNGYFLAVSYGGSIVIKSTDGVNWSATSGHPESSDSYSKFYQRVAYGNGKFVALSSTGYITTSTDGNSWSTPTQKLGDNHYFFCLHYLGGRFIAIGSKSAATSIWTATSTDGTNWSSVSEIANKGSTIYQWCTYVDSKYNAYSGQGTKITSASADSTTSWNGPVTLDIGSNQWRHGINDRYIGYYGHCGYTTATAQSYIDVAHTSSDTLKHVRDTSKDKL